MPFKVYSFENVSGDKKRPDSAKAGRRLKSSDGSSGAQYEMQDQGDYSEN